MASSFNQYFNMLLQNGMKLFEQPTVLLVLGSFPRRGTNVTRSVKDQTTGLAGGSLAPYVAMGAYATLA